MISTQEDLSSLKQQLRRQLTDSIADVIKALKEALPSHASKLDTVLMLESRLNEANRDKLRGVISQEDLQLVYNQLRAGLLDLIAGLQLADFATATTAVPQPDKTGSLLYKIPGQMPLGEESKCIIRLAFEEESIIRNIELNEDVTLKPIRIAQVMDVELVDPNSEPTFTIRTLSSPEQFVEKGDYTEWIFYVKPLRAGTFPLLVKISVIEIIQEKERKKEIVLEEKVQIVATSALPETDSLPFKPAGYALTYGERTAPLEPPATGSPSEVIMPIPPPASLPQQKPQARRRSLVQPLSIAASLLLITSFAIYYFSPDNKNIPSDSEKWTAATEAPADSIPTGNAKPQEKEPLIGAWMVTSIITTPENQTQQNADLERSSPIYYTFREDNTLVISSKVSDENVQYSFQSPDRVLFKGQTWEGTGQLLFQTNDSLALQLTVKYPGDKEFPMTVQFRKKK